jgi:hypothetical protein
MAASEVQAVEAGTPLSITKHQHRVFYGPNGRSSDKSTGRNYRDIPAPGKDGRVSTKSTPLFAKTNEFRLRIVAALELSP